MTRSRFFSASRLRRATSSFSASCGRSHARTMSPLARRWGCDRHPRVRLSAALLLAVVAGRLAAGVWGVMLQYFEVALPGQDIDPSRLFPPGFVGVTMAFLVAVVLAPLTEEIVFRGILLSSLDRRWGSTVAIVGSSALFAAMHVSLYAIPPIFVLALILGWLFVRTRSLTVCIVAHAAFNGIGLAALYAAKAAGLL